MDPVQRGGPWTPGPYFVLTRPPRSETSAAHEYASFSQPRYKKVRYACVYLVLSATDQAKAVAELIQHVRETTLEAVEQDVGETTVNLLVDIVCLFCIVLTPVV